MTEELDAVFFDLGGTLVDTTVPREKIWSDVLHRQGEDVDPTELTAALRMADRDLDERFADIQGVDEKPFWIEYDSAVLKRLGTRLEAEDVIRDLSDSMARMVMDEANWKDYTDVRPFLDDLGSRDLGIGLISNATDLARRVLRRLNLERYFDPIIISSEVGHRKPSERIFQIALAEAGVASSRAMYIGDKPAVDVMGAINAGMNAVLIDRGDLFRDSDCIRIPSLSYLGTYVRA